MNKLIIIGASGHGKVVADIAALNGYKEIVFLDNDPEIKACAGYPVLGPDTMTSELDGDVFIAVGNAETRKKLMERDANRNFPVLIHPSAVIAKSAEVGAGSVAMAGAVSTAARSSSPALTASSSPADLSRSSPGWPSRCWGCQSW